MPAKKMSRKGQKRPVTNKKKAAKGGRKFHPPKKRK